MSLYILDTDHVSLFQQGQPDLTRRIALADPAELAVTIVTVEEQMRGWLDAIRQAKTPSRLVSAYARLQTTLDYFSAITILPYSLRASDHFTQLRQLKLRVGTQDLRIAAIAAISNATLVTRNRRDFAQVPGLSLQDWTTS